ncbi:MAG: T9SS type A sorting domain-containing protein [Flavobacteriales bacterium]|nr:T9SS type A sorting domain-containing protein [Flavobacteriales bacterium]
MFDVYLSDEQDGPLVMMPNPGTQLGDAMTGNQLHFNGPQVLAANGGTGARMYAPSTFALGSSCVHFNESTFPPGDPDELMTPFSSTGDANHWPGPLCLALMQDIGWVLAPDVSVQERPVAEVAQAWPNPAVDVLHVRLPGLVPGEMLRIVDGTGRTVGRVAYGDPLSVGELAPGVYTVNAEGEGAGLRFIRAEQ